jgi:uncharacterized protein with GYD domain
MPLFALMTRLTADALKDPDGRRAMGKVWLHKAKECCPNVRWIGHYAILGPYDFMDIYEAPDVETAHTISALSRAEGAVAAESWQLLPYEDFMKLLEKVT